MKALALENPDGCRVVLITSDFQSISEGMSDHVFAQLRQRFMLEQHQVTLTFSHNHCGPRLGNDLVDYYPIEAERVANEIKQCAPLAVQAIKRIVKAGRDLPLAESWKMAEPIQEQINKTEDRLEGPKAFAEGRDPIWQMR